MVPPKMTLCHFRGHPWERSETSVGRDSCYPPLSFSVKEVDNKIGGEWEITALEKNKC